MSIILRFITRQKMKRRLYDNGICWIDPRDILNSVKIIASKNRRFLMEPGGEEQQQLKNDEIDFLLRLHGCY